MRANSKFEPIYRDLLEKIRSGYFQAGETLPTEIDLAEQYGVAVLTLRRALARLREDGLIVSRPRHGSRVIAPGECVSGSKEVKSKTLGLLASPHVNLLAHPPLSQIISGMQGIASQAGYTLDIVFNDASNPELLGQLLEKLERSQVQGWVIPTFLSEPVRSFFIKSHLPVVLVHYLDEAITGHIFQIDMENLARVILTYLEEQGRENIWLFGMEISAGWRDAFVKIAADKGISDRVRTRFISDYTAQASIDATKALLSAGERIDAILCADDNIAAGAIQALQGAGHTVPGDVSVIGGGDFPISSLLSPTITTISYPHYTIGRDAARLLIDLLEGVDVPPVHRLFLPKLLIRESSAAPLVTRC